MYMHPTLSGMWNLYTENEFFEQETPSVAVTKGCDLDKYYMPLSQSRF